MALNQDVKYTFDSTHIKSATYEPVTQLLIVEFHSGTIYGYETVPAEVFNKWKEAPSAGNYFNRNIRNKYIHTQLE